MIDGSVSEDTKRKRINNINEIYDGNNLLTKEFIHLDLSNIDLSCIPKEKWEDCIFYNTSFKNTNIKFIPNKLRRISCEEINKLKFKKCYSNCICMNFCDFSDNDLTYLKYEDFCKNGSFFEIYYYGCDFSNTKINFLKHLENVKVDSSYKEFDYDYWRMARGCMYICVCDFATLIKNPYINFPSNRFIHALGCARSNIINYCTEVKKMSRDETIQVLEDYLELDKEGYVRNLYYKLKPCLNLDGKYRFFLGQIYGQDLKNIDLSDIPLIVLDEFRMNNNKLENITINYSFKDLLKLNPEFILDFEGSNNVYKSFYTPGIDYSSWQDNVGAKKRISTSKLSFFTKVYLELDRICNAKCDFCRNSSFERCNYDIDKIKETLYMIKNYINALVIGGGEPTLKLDDVKNLRESIKDSKFDWHLFSNGTNPDFINDDYIMENFKLNISRHAVSDNDNANIFKVNRIMTTKDLEKLNMRNNEVTLNAVCFNGGLDSFEKIIDYIKYAKDIGCRKVLIQDLQRSMSLGNNDIKYNNMFIDENIFSKVRDYLKSIGFREKYPIYATGGYVSYILKNKEGFSVTLQRYINQNDLDKEWSRAIKRTFDLSIDPSGNLYENWNQKNGLIKTLKK